ncbi:MAG: ubiquinone/menaquinone biosynthesis C-methylase UbiE [Candidatus Latescibacterota bacterium]
MSTETVDGDKVRRYFDGAAERFDAIYRSDKSVGQKLIDGLFRGVIHRRFELTFELLGSPEGKRVLDVGCGSARYAVELARRGAEVVGLDFAAGMVELAQEAANEAGIADRCHFEQCDFLTWSDPGHFDICLAIGFFDYIDNPGVFLQQMRALEPQQCVFSFPIRWTLRTLPRWLRLNANGCPVYFYSADQVESLMRESGWEHVEVHRLSRDFLVHARLD